MHMQRKQNSYACKPKPFMTNMLTVNQNYKTYISKYRERSLDNTQLEHGGASNPADYTHQTTTTTKKLLQKP